MKTAEEILNKYESFNYKTDELDETHYYRDNVLMAMNEYAMQFIQPIKCWQCNGEGKTLIGICDNHTCQICMGEGKLIILPTQSIT